MTGIESETLLPLLDQTPLILDFDMDQFHQRGVSRSRCLLGTNTTDHEFCSDPLHSKTISDDLISYIVVTTHNMPCVFGVPVRTSHRNCTFLSKNIVVGSIDESSIPSNSHSNILRWLAAMNATQPSLYSASADDSATGSGMFEL